MPQNYDPRDYLTPRQVAELLHITPDAVRKQIGTVIPPDKVLRTGTGRILIHRDAIQLRADEPTE